MQDEIKEDEIKITRNYKPMLASIYAAIPFAVAYYFDTKWVIAAGCAVLFFELNEFSGRLHDPCVRLRRTNILLNERLTSYRR
ncbi:MAG: hypothetical protein WCD20_02610 [Rhodomicrobium sp.]